MSLFRTVQTVVRQHGALSRTTVGYRFNSSNAPAPTQSKESAIVTPEAPNQEILAADTISGAPSELRRRVVRIYQPTRNTMQSASGKTERWRVDFDILPGGSRWENPLMGYASSADYVQPVRLSFYTKEEAAQFAERQGWDYYVQPPAVKRIPPKNYAENFVYRPDTLRIMRTK
ncbi:NADH-ubiquinone oxidoreductase 21kDa subunit [Coprinopsis marcescibilis]|uniref:NADH dehydrogenase [ubiquinone] iron-sulfur protein 4, mitochondrial n=1 Tax=Coprinopsis marcescibilis TaxID=230819 RepID=A0A5C3L618_COPMA|nr:NADH-ubiquinone oxidoreductase 21kDa subunit [Coprinopsis marcescibilis]